MTDAHGVARDQLRAFVERIERLEEEKKTIADDIKDVYGEAKSMGFDTKILKMVISLRKKDEQQRTEEEIILDTYLQALGMIPAFEREEDKPVTATKSTAPRKDVDQSTLENNGRVGSALQNPGYAERPEPVHPEAGTQALPVDTNSASAPQGEADAPSEQVSPSNADQPDRPTGGVKACSANIGGDHVTETLHFAAIRPGLVSNSPANHPLRPNCKNPGSQCAGYGSKLCHACAVAVRELETA